MPDPFFRPSLGELDGDAAIVPIHVERRRELEALGQDHVAEHHLVGLEGPEAALEDAQLGRVLRVGLEMEGVIDALKTGPDGRKIYTYKFKPAR